MIRLCRDLLNVENPNNNNNVDEDSGSGRTGGETGGDGNGEAAGSDSTSSSYARGHFYTNDIKVSERVAVND